MPSFAAIRAIEYHLPATVLDNRELSRLFPEWGVEKIAAKTGIHRRHIAAENETSADLAVAAAQKLFASGVCRPADIDFIMLCTQSPDYFLPTSACLIQHRLAIPSDAGALDFNLGCSGYVYGLGLAKGLIESGQAQRVLLLTAETYSKFIHPADKSVRTLFGDGASATLVSATEDLSEEMLGPFVFGTDGSGGPHLIVPAGGMRRRCDASTSVSSIDASANVRTAANLAMNGAEVFSFAMRRVPACVEALLRRADLTLDAIDAFVFHQANAHMLEQLRRKLGIEAHKFIVTLEECGNTVSSTLPIACKIAAQRGQLRAGQRIMLVGFGVGYSWGASLVRCMC